MRSTRNSSERTEQHHERIAREYGTSITHNEYRGSSESVRSVADRTNVSAADPTESPQIGSLDADDRCPRDASRNGGYSDAQTRPQSEDAYHSDSGDCPRAGCHGDVTILDGQVVCETCGSIPEDETIPTEPSNVRYENSGKYRMVGGFERAYDNGGDEDGDEYEYDLSSGFLDT